jgi:hypothetical protein
MTCGIYKITNIVNDKIYIGSSKHIESRWSCHLSDLRRNDHHSKHLQRAADKYDISVFKFEILQETKEEELIKVEQEYLDKLRPYDKNIGYNISDKAERISGEALKKCFTIEIREKISNSMKNSKAFKESHNTKEYKAESSERAKQQWQDPDIRAKMMDSLNSEESRAKKSAAAKRISLDPEFKRKHREGIEKSFTPERRANLSKYAKEYFSAPENRHKQCLNSPHRKQIMCKETGVVYDSVACAAKDIGVSSKSIRSATQPGRTCRGLTFEYIEK